MARGAGGAKDLGLPFDDNVKLGPGATETFAREARYRWLQTLAGSSGAWLFTAYRDGRVETVLMRVLKEPCRWPVLRRSRNVGTPAPSFIARRFGHGLKAGIAAWNDRRIAMQASPVRLRTELLPARTHAGSDRAHRTRGRRRPIGPRGFVVSDSVSSRAGRQGFTFDAVSARPANR